MSKDNINCELKSLLQDLKSTDLDTRQQAAYNIHKFSEEHTDESFIAIPSLKEAMNDSDWVVRKMSILALGELDVKEEIPRLIDFLKNDNEPEVRVGAAEALGDMKAENALEGLIAALDDPYEMVQQVTLWSIGKLGEKAKIALPKLIEFLSIPDSTAIVQKTNIAAWALGEVGDKRAIDPLNKALKEAQYHDRKYNVASSLALLEGKDGEGFAELIKMKNLDELFPHELEEFEELEKKIRE